MKLDNCPFCGKKAGFERSEVGVNSGCALIYFRIKCKSCGATAPGAYGYVSVSLSVEGEVNVIHDDREEAAKAWNRRA